MARTFKILSLLLSYPSEELQAAAGEFAPVLAAEGLLPPPVRAGLAPLLDELQQHDLLDLQQRYVLLFDRSRALSLHLFEHVHGESRDRGQAMVDLATLYEDHGFVLSARELPDYLPMFLEFLAQLPAGEARELLAEPLHVIAAIRRRLATRDSVYAAPFRAMEALAAAAPDRDALAELLAAPDEDPGDLAALDRQWEDVPVSFGPETGQDAGGCSLAADMVRRFAVPPEDPGPARQLQTGEGP